MKVLLSSLNKLIDLTGLTAREIADSLTFAGLKVDAVENLGKGYEKVYTGKIEKIEKHPDAEKLTVCTVNIKSKTLSIVCGAKNMIEGDIVPVATVGANLPCGLEIKEAKLRGVQSCGMLCSQKELGLAKESSGLMILPKETPVGEEFAAFMGLNDWLFDIDVTAQRGDCMSVLGIARELSAIYGRALKMPEYKFSECVSKKTKDKIKISIAAKDLCPRYCARVIENVKIGASPEWLVKTLENIGMRSVNNIVDVTNFITYMYGHPSHAFDLNKLPASEINVRRAVENETITAIDNKSYQLTNEMLLICSQDKPQAIAGVMGGKNSEVDENTTAILLEVATFNAISVRKTSKKLNLVSESSQRFTRGINIQNSEYVINALASLIQALSPGAVVYSEILDNGEKTLPLNTLKMTTEDLSQFVGQKFEENEVLDIFQKLNFKIEKHGAELRLTAPPYRHDINYVCDLYEEFLRIYGYNKVNDVEVSYPYSKPIESSYDTVRKLTEFFINSGFCQCMNYSFLGKNDLEKIKFAGCEESNLVKIRNPLGSEYSIMRPSMLYGLLNTMLYNNNQKYENIRLFEIGKTYKLAKNYISEEDFKTKHIPAIPVDGKLHPIVETQLVTGLMYGRADENQWNASKKDYDFYRLKGVIENLITAFKLKIDFKPVNDYSKILHPKKSAAICLKSGEIIGYAGVLHPEIAKNFDIDYSREVLIFELNTAPFIENLSKPFRLKYPSKFPASVYDLAVLISKDKTYSEIEKLCYKIGGKNLVKVTPFDEYTGEKVASDKKSVAFTLTFQSNEGTLNDAETKKSFEEIISAIKEKLGGELRA
ncbi:MAG: phenylalanine--tRNA ligase subunit beta [Candidatus Wallbacteria bacterium]